MRPPVSFDSEPLILVDSDDEPIGSATKRDAHDGEGRLHRAFSVFLFDDDDRLLLTRRSALKRLWPGIWSNSCCSHPRVGERVEEAARRRVEEELGLSVSLTWLYKFEYRARWRDEGSEHELCHVLVGRVSADPLVHEDEISEWQWVAPGVLDADLVARPERYSPWMKLEWARLRGDFWPQIAGVTA